MNIINMRGIIAVTDNGVFPEAPLPDATFLAFELHSRALLVLRNGFRKSFFNRLPAPGIIRIVFRQCPDTMQMIRQHHPRIDMKRAGLSGFTNGITQYVNMLHQQTGLAVKQIDGKEIRTTRKAIAPVIGHGFLQDGNTKPIIPHSSRGINEVPSTITND